VGADELYDTLVEVRPDRSPPPFTRSGTCRDVLELPEPTHVDRRHLDSDRELLLVGRVDDRDRPGRRRALGALVLRLEAPKEARDLFERALGRRQADTLERTCSFDT
jgi:hypothetical protein